MYIRQTLVAGKTFGYQVFLNLRIPCCAIACDFASLLSSRFAIKNSG
ncbi:hypothetical protein FVEG_04623 [Fusarium verticillioides 7600]|uniref:Uncharacterized protein n=1 Tax=Gibberella moniliformis (strain M3125 / FGSC 7600) TaxID=334819 RepID=W7LUR1_GIBM7|nr:hypothetical protein FVEG_04623 [Fusarium verticillioides 7600]EWG42953.1 hypothetical protein FVEG_04623 [Fusarium verticillioides 7600]